MKILNETKTQEIKRENIDFALGKLVEDSIIAGQEPDVIVVTTDENGNTSTKAKTMKNVYEKVYVYAPYTQQEIYQNEIISLLKWFDEDYRTQFEKFARKADLGLSLKDGSNPKEKLRELYAQAETNSGRINQLKELVKETQNVIEQPQNNENDMPNNTWL